MRQEQLDWKQPYKPTKATNQQLADDWRLLIAAVANLEREVDEPYTAKEVYDWAVTCAKEIAKRVKIGNMVYAIAEEKGDIYKKLWTEVSKRLEVWELSVLTDTLDSLDLLELNLDSKQAEQIVSGKKSMIVSQTNNVEYLRKTLILCSIGFSLCTLKLRQRDKATRMELEELYPEHRMTPEDLREKWPKGDSFFCYDIYDFCLLDTLRDAQVSRATRLLVKEKVELSDSRHRNDSEELAPVTPSGIETGEEIKLEDLTKYFKSFYRTKPYVSLVGGICNWGKTKGDVDFFINAAHRDIATEFRIYRMFPQEYWHRFRFMYPGETHPGKFTDHIDIFNEKIEVVSSPELVLMSSPKKVELFEFAKLLKPTYGHYKGEEYEIENLIKVVNAKPEWYERKIAVQIKYDGIHVRADHGKGGKVVIWTEEGTEITDKLPTIVSDLKTICKGHDVAVVGELESWEDKKHMARQLSTGIIHSKGIHAKEKTLKLNIFDCLYYS